MSHLNRTGVDLPGNLWYFEVAGCWHVAPEGKGDETEYVKSLCGRETATVPGYKQVFYLIGGQTFCRECCCEH